MKLLSNVFYDPSSPWYYVVGVIFLVLIFGALTAYILLSKKFGKDKKQESDEPTGAENNAEPISNDDSDAVANAETPIDGTNDKSGENK